MNLYLYLRELLHESILSSKKSLRSTYLSRGSTSGSIRHHSSNTIEQSVLLNNFLKLEPFTPLV